LSAMSRHVPDNWDHYLQPVLFAYRTTPHSATGVSPFLLSLGRQPNLPTQSIFGRDPIDTDPITVFDYLANLESTLKTVYNKAGINIKQAQAASKRKYDFSAKEDQWEVGDIVWWYNQRTKRGNLYKLARCYTGPMRIKELRNQIAILEYIDKGTQKTEKVHLDKLSRAYNCYSNEVATVTTFASNGFTQITNHAFIPTRKPVTTVVKTRPDGGIDLQKATVSDEASKYRSDSLASAVVGYISQQKFEKVIILSQT
ncbi:MAG: hypothetical protein GY740_02580, partial [Gammaproteobacteria bacterium]|nr:hypothetical protein [Gammaproteobacteria bacterium]